MATSAIGVALYGVMLRTWCDFGYVVSVLSGDRNIQTKPGQKMGEDVIGRQTWFVTAANRAMPNVQVLLYDIDALRNDIFGTVQRVTKNLQAVAELCTTEPAFTARTVENLGVASSTAYTIINRLVEHNILRPEQKIRGQSVLSVRALTDALDAFAERAGRRS